MFKHLFLPWLLPMFGMFFAAGADALAGGGGDVGAIPDAGGEGSDDLGYGGDSGEETGADDAAAVDQPAADEKPIVDKEEPEVQEFRGAVSNRLRGLVKQSPKLAEAFKENPKLQEQIEATFRREAALREVFPTVAEARQMRETFPNGLQDVQQLQNDVKEVEQLDADLYTRDHEGNYPGHAKVVENLFRDNKEAAISLFRNMPKEWARHDRDSYNEVMGKIVGATIANAREWEDFDNALQSGDQKAIEAAGKKLFGWANGYLQGKPKPSEEEQRLSKDRQSFNKEKQDREKEEGQRFHTSFVTESRKLQTNIIKTHPAVKKLLENKTIPDTKKSEIIESVRKQIESLLGKSSSFMRPLKAAHGSRNLQETINLQKAAWSQQWRLNSAVRTVFGKEIPNLVQSNKDALRRRAGAPQTQKPVTGDKNTAPQGPKKMSDGRWYRNGGKGEPFTTQEVLAGKHEQ